MRLLAIMLCACICAAADLASIHKATLTTLQEAAASMESLPKPAMRRPTMTRAEAANLDSRAAQQEYMAAFRAWDAYDKAQGMPKATRAWIKSIALEPADPKRMAEQIRTAQSQIDQMVRYLVPNL